MMLLAYWQAAAVEHSRRAASSNTDDNEQPLELTVEKKNITPKETSSGAPRAYSKQNLTAATNAVLDGSMTVIQASSAYGRKCLCTVFARTIAGVPRSTLRNHVNVQGEQRGCFRVKHRGKYRNYGVNELEMVKISVRCC